MTSIVAGGIFNAVAFAEAGFLFSKLNHNGYEDDIKRHNKALEDLAQAKKAWTERETARKNKILRLRLERADADKDFERANRALRLLQKVKKASAVDHELTIHDRVRFCCSIVRQSCQSFQDRRNRTKLSNLNIIHHLISVPHFIIIIIIIVY